MGDVTGETPPPVRQLVQQYNRATGSILLPRHAKIWVQLQRTLLPQAREGFTWYEHYPAQEDVPGRYRREESFDEVTFRLVGPFEVAAPRWTPSSRAAVEALIGQPVRPLRPETTDGDGVMDRGTDLDPDPDMDTPEAAFARCVADAEATYHHRMRFDGWADRPLPKLYQCRRCGATAMLYAEAARGHTVHDLDPRLFVACARAGDDDDADSQG